MGTIVELKDLIQHYPILYHMAADGSWESIRTNGLMTTAQLVDACAPHDEERRAVLTVVRRRTFILKHPAGHSVSVRDQAPLREPFLGECLVDVSVPEWLDILNGRVFFWLHPTRLSELLNARRYRGSAHDVLSVDTASLVQAHTDNVRLSPINSGATLYPNAPLRGLSTFRAVSEYPFNPGPRGGAVRNAIAELAVVDGVPDIAQHVIRVERRQRDTVLEVIVP
jgi:hypothetical protein